MVRKDAEKAVETRGLTYAKLIKTILAYKRFGRERNFAMNNCFLKKQEIKKTDRLIELDLLKAAALFAVVFYHIGIQTYFAPQFEDIGASGKGGT